LAADDARIVGVDEREQLARVRRGEGQLRGRVVREVLGVSVARTKGQETEQTAKGRVRIVRVHRRRTEVLAREENGAGRVGERVPDARPAAARAASVVRADAVTGFEADVAKDV